MIRSFDIDIIDKSNNYQKKHWLNILWDSLWICLYFDNWSTHFNMKHSDLKESKNMFRLADNLSRTTTLSWYESWRNSNMNTECVRAAKNIWTVLDMLWIETIRLKTWYCFIIADIRTITQQCRSLSSDGWGCIRSSRRILEKENYVLAELDGVKRLIQCQNSDWNHMFFIISLLIMSIIDILMHILKVTAQTSI
jgi:hypothetical protein